MIVRRKQNTLYCIVECKFEQILELINRISGLSQNQFLSIMLLSAVLPMNAWFYLMLTEKLH